MIISFAVFIADDGSINCKVVYWGTGLAGRTTNLQYLNQDIDRARREELTHWAAEGQRSLILRFLVDGVTPAGRPLRLHLYTVPGATYLSDEFHLMILRGFEAIVCVIDSQAERLEANREVLQRLHRLLARMGRRVEDEIVVFQYSKRDLANSLPISALERELNTLGLPFRAAIPVTGEGVWETVDAVTERIAARLRVALAT